MSDTMTCGVPHLPVWLLIIIAIYIVAFGALSVVKHDTMHSFTFDLVICLSCESRDIGGKHSDHSLGEGREQ